MLCLDSVMYSQDCKQAHVFISLTHYFPVFHKWNIDFYAELQNNSVNNGLNSYTHLLWGNKSSILATYYAAARRHLVNYLTKSSQTSQNQQISIGCYGKY